MGGCQVLLKVTLVFFFPSSAYEVSIKKKLPRFCGPRTQKHKQALRLMDRDVLKRRVSSENYSWAWIPISMRLMKKLLNLDHKNFTNIFVFQPYVATYIGFSSPVWLNDLNVTAWTLWNLIFFYLFSSWL